MTGFTKYNRKNKAVGVWATPRRPVVLRQTAEAIRVLLQDKLLMMGKYVSLYLPVTADTPGVVACTCVKDTTQSADKTCRSCYGCHYCPGFTKFLHETQFWCSAEFSSFTVTTNVVVDTKLKPNRVKITDGQTSGTFTTQTKTFTQDADDLQDFEIHTDAYNRTSTSTIALEVSVNGGAFTSVAVDGTITAPSVGGTFQFRVTMTRAAAADPSPMFEIIRVRRVLTENENEQIIRRRDDHVAGSLLLLQPWIADADSLDPNRGLLLDHVGNRAWTAPLDFFDESLTHDTIPCRVDDALGNHPFYEYSSGVQESVRYAIVKTYVSEKLHIFTHQYFDDRRIQANEALSAVF